MHERSKIQNKPSGEEENDGFDEAAWSKDRKKNVNKNRKKKPPFCLKDIHDLRLKNLPNFYANYNPSKHVTTFSLFPISYFDFSSSDDKAKTAVEDPGNQLSSHINPNDTDIFNQDTEQFTNIKRAPTRR